MRRLSACHAFDTTEQIMPRPFSLSKICIVCVAAPGVSRLADQEMMPQELHRHRFSGCPRATELDAVMCIPIRQHPSPTRTASSDGRHPRLRAATWQSTGSSIQEKYNHPNRRRDGEGVARHGLCKAISDLSARCQTFTIQETTATAAAAGA
jgi:hypothetical protein